MNVGFKYILRQANRQAAVDVVAHVCIDSDEVGMDASLLPVRDQPIADKTVHRIMTAREEHYQGRGISRGVWVKLRGNRFCGGQPRSTSYECVQDG